MRRSPAGAATGVSGPTANWTQDYSYDRYGNKTGTSASGITADSNNVPLDGLPSIGYNAASNGISTSGWEYDLTGNLIRGKNESGVWQLFEYDAAGRLVKIKDDSDNVLETYTYGASRNRLKNETTTQRTYYAWGGNSPIVEYTEPTASSTPSFSKSYVYAGSRLVSTATKTSSTTEATVFHHPDRLGTKLMINQNTLAVDRQSTLPFGTALGAESTAYSNQVFTSYDRSASTGLDYAVNRTYSEGQSRFTQADPIGMSAATVGDPQSLNLYSYTHNTPTDRHDPTGLDDAIDQGVNGALDALSSSLCRNFLRRTQGSHYPNWDPRQIVSAYASQGFITSGQTYNSSGVQKSFAGADVGAVTTLGFYTVPGGLRIDGVGLTASAITINRNGFYYTWTDSKKKLVATKPEFSGLSGSEIRAAVILHEIAHAFGIIPHDGPGSPDGQSRANSQLIKKMCFSPMARLFRDRQEPVTGGGGGIIGTEIYPQPTEHVGSFWDWYSSWFFHWASQQRRYETDVFIEETDVIVHDE